MFIQSELSLPRQVLSLGFLKTDKCRTLGTGFILPPFSHTPVVGSGVPFPEPATQLEGRELRKSVSAVLKLTSQHQIPAESAQVNEVSSSDGALSAGYATSRCTFVEGC